MLSKLLGGGGERMGGKEGGEGVKWGGTASN